jgi:hypothetical protein
VAGEKENLMSTTLKERFDQLDSERTNKLTRAREAAAVTVPSLLPHEGYNDTQDLTVPFNSLPARGVVQLGSRLTNVIAPLNNIPFFSLQLDDEIPPEGHDPAPEMEIFGRLERRVMDKLYSTNHRSNLLDAMEQLQVVGDVVIRIRPDYSFQLYTLDNFVIKRRTNGDWYEMLVREYVDGSNLPDELLEAGYDNEAQPSMPTKTMEPLFIRITRMDVYGAKVEMEFRDRVFDTEEQRASKWVPLSWRLITGDDYSRSHVEDNLGDIRTLQGLSEARLLILAAAADFRMGVNPAGVTNLEDLKDSTVGDWVPATPGDVFTIFADMHPNVENIHQAVREQERAVGQIFLLHTASQRHAERVTAKEVQAVAEELEQGLSGVLSGLQRQYHLPLVLAYLTMMLEDKLLLPDSGDQVEKFIDALLDPDGVLKISVRTGLEALWREVENEKLTTFLSIAQGLPEQAHQAINWPGFLNRWVATFGLEPTGLIKSEEQLAEEAQAAQEQAMQMQAQQAMMQQASQPPPEEAPPQ